MPCGSGDDVSGAAELLASGPARTTGPDSWFLASTPDGFALTTSAGVMAFTVVTGNRVDSAYDKAKIDLLRLDNG